MPGRYSNQINLLFPFSHRFRTFFIPSFFLTGKDEIHRKDPGLESGPWTWILISWSILLLISLLHRTKTGATNHHHEVFRGRRTSTTSPEKKFLRSSFLLLLSRRLLWHSAARVTTRLFPSTSTYRSLFYNSPVSRSYNVPVIVRHQSDRRIIAATLSVRSIDQFDVLLWGGFHFDTQKQSHHLTFFHLLAGLAKQKPHLRLHRTFDLLWHLSLKIPLPHQRLTFLVLVEGAPFETFFSERSQTSQARLQAPLRLSSSSLSSVVVVVKVTAASKQEKHTVN